MFTEKLKKVKPNRDCFAVVDDPRELASTNKDLKKYGIEPFVGADTPINGGFYTPRDGRGLSVQMDYSKNDPALTPPIYGDYLKEVEARMTNKYARQPNLLRLPRAVCDTVQSRMKLATKWRPVERSGDSIDALSQFMSSGRCEAHHMTLAAAALIDLEVPGLSVSVETGIRLNQKQPDDREVHTWVRYREPRSRKVYIIDPAKGYCGTLEDSVEKADWDYLRPEDEEHFYLPHEIPIDPGKVAIISLAEYRTKKAAKVAQTSDLD